MTTRSKRLILLNKCGTHPIKKNYCYRDNVVNHMMNKINNNLNQIFKKNLIKRLIRPLKGNKNNFNR